MKYDAKNLITEERIKELGQGNADFEAVVRDVAVRWNRFIETGEDYYTQIRLDAVRQMIKEKREQFRQ